MNRYFQPRCMPESDALFTQVMALIQNILDELELSFSQVVRSDVHLTNLDDFDAMDAAYKEFFKAGKYPARTTTESRRLFGGSLVEVTCMVRLAKLE